MKRGPAGVGMSEVEGESNDDAKEMAICGACKALIPADSTSCPECDVSFTGISEDELGECGSCGALVPINSKSCSQCGVYFVLDDLTTALTGWMKDEDITISDLFMEVDADNDGSLTAEEVKDALLSRNLAFLPHHDLDRFLNQIDLNSDGVITLGELAAALSMPWSPPTVLEPVETDHESEESDDEAEEEESDDEDSEDEADEEESEDDEDDDSEDDDEEEESDDDDSEDEAEEEESEDDEDDDSEDDDEEEESEDDEDDDSEDDDEEEESEDDEDDDSEDDDEEEESEEEGDDSDDDDGEEESDDEEDDDSEDEAEEEESEEEEDDDSEDEAEEEESEDDADSEPKVKTHSNWQKFLMRHYENVFPILYVVGVLFVGIWLVNGIIGPVDGSGGNIVFDGDAPAVTSSGQEVLPGDVYPCDESIQECSNSLTPLAGDASSMPVGFYWDGILFIILGILCLAGVGFLQYQVNDWRAAHRRSKYSSEDNDEDSSDDWVDSDDESDDDDDESDDDDDESDDDDDESDGDDDESDDDDDESDDDDDESDDDDDESDDGDDEINVGSRVGVEDGDGDWYGTVTGFNDDDDTVTVKREDDDEEYDVDWDALFLE